MSCQCDAGVLFCILEETVWYMLSVISKTEQNYLLLGTGGTSAVACVPSVGHHTKM